MAGNNQYKAPEFIAAIPGTGGIISAIARKVGCAWHTAKKYIDTYPTINKAYRDEAESVLDIAEVALIRATKDGEAWAVKYMLSTKGKDRGFTERQEITGADGGPMEHRFTSFERILKRVYGEDNDAT